MSGGQGAGARHAQRCGLRDVACGGCHLCIACDGAGAQDQVVAADQLHIVGLQTDDATKLVRHIGQGHIACACIDVGGTRHTQGCIGGAVGRRLLHHVTTVGLHVQATAHIGRAQVHLLAIGGRCQATCHSGLAKRHRALGAAHVQATRDVGTAQIHVITADQGQIPPRDEGRA